MARWSRFRSSMSIGTAILLAWLLWSNLSKPTAFLDYEKYDTVADLADDSGAVIVAQIGSELQEWEDRGGNPPVIEGKTIEGRPMVLIEVAVTEVLAGSVTTKTLVVARPDLDRIRVDNLAPLDEGENQVLFLDYVPKQRAPDIPEGYDGVWVLVGGDGGVFDVDGTIATPRLGPLSLDTGGARVESLTIEDIAAVIG